MKNQLVKSNSFLMMIGMFLALTFALSVSAQKMDNNGSIKPFPPVQDTSMNPHDFADKYYAMNGVNPNYIIGRRTGYDFLSVIDWSSNPFHTNVRILATLPAYGSSGEILFFSPLGEINNKGFTEDSVGIQAREMADMDPIYVFPLNTSDILTTSDSFAPGKTRQAALMDSSVSSPNMTGYSIGLRSIIVVNYTKKAYTDEDVQMMSNMLKKNGRSLDGTPLIKSFEDLTALAKYELVSMEKRGLWDNSEFAGTYAINPIIYKPVNGVIASDAFLLTITQKGDPLQDEQMFIDEFNCLRKAGRWCSEF